MTDPSVTRIAARDVAIALSLANICYLRIWAEILAVTSTEAYFLSVANSDVLAVVLNVLLLAAAFLGATAIARRFGRRGRIAIIAGFVTVLAAQLNALGPELAPGVLSVIDRWRNGLYLEALAPVVVLLAIVAAAVRWPERSLKLTVGLVYILTPFVAVTFARAAWILVSVNPTHALAPLAPPIGTPVAEAAGPRVVVIVMDALSAHHAIDARPPGFELPEFDRFRAGAIDAREVTQIGRTTGVSIPAMLSGLRVTDSRPISDDELLLTIDSTETQPWSTAPNLLRDADSLGGVAILAGWYHPYCRLFPDLDGCSTYPTRTIGSRGRDTGFWRALVDQQLALIPYTSLRLRQIEIVESQRDDALEAVTTGGRGLVFLHLILPHTPWIWDEESESYTVTRFDPDGYYDNLHLMDRVLGELRREMEAAGKWDGTAVLLLSDHVMRYRPQYLNEPADPRVPFILKLPGQATGVVYERPFSAMVTHDLVTALLRGELTTVGAATAWLDQVSAPAP
ncbi:MAG: sulfatase-like hydrolase/transferase [Gemmatimonadaceae bacterium]